jgi:hypothetical protein
VQAILNAVMALNPIMLIIILIVALVAAFVVLWKKSEKFRNFFIGIWNAIKKAFAAVVDWLKTACSNIVNFFVSAWEGIKSAFASVGAFFKGIWDGIVGVFSSVVTWFSDTFTAAWEGIKSVFSAVGAFFSGIWQTIKDMFTKIGSTIGDAISGAFKTVVNAIISFAEGIINGFIRAINGAIKLINNIPGVNIKLISELELPKLAKGSNSSPDTFIAGEKGAELVTNAKGRKVFTAAETGNIFDTLNIVDALKSLAQKTSKPSAGTVATTTSEASNKQITQNVNITNQFSGDRAGQQKSAAAMDKAAKDSTGYMARSLAYVR